VPAGGSWAAEHALLLAVAWQSWFRSRCAGIVAWAGEPRHGMMRARGGRTEMAHEPGHAVVEWGGRPPGRLRRRLAAPRVDRRAAPVLAGLGAAAALGALLSDWQSASPALGTDLDGVSVRETYRAGIAALGPWGTALLLGLVTVAVCAGVTFVGDRRLRPYGRSFGLVVTAVQVGLLVAATADLSRRSAIYNFLGGAFGDVDLEIRLERGVSLAYLAVALAAAALYLAPSDPAVVARPGAGPGGTSTPVDGPEPAEATVDGRRRSPAEPAAFGAPEVTVAPAEPFRYVTERDEWV
jgi:hypothetical protein